MVIVRGCREGNMELLFIDRHRVSVNIHIHSYIHIYMNECLSDLGEEYILATNQSEHMK